MKGKFWNLHKKVEKPNWNMILDSRIDKFTNVCLSISQIYINYHQKNTVVNQLLYVLSFWYTIFDIILSYQGNTF